MNGNSFLIQWVFTLFIQIILLAPASGQIKKTLLLNEGSQKRVFSLKQKNIQKANFGTEFIDTTSFSVIRKSIIHYQPYQYLWQNYKSGKFPADSIRNILVTARVDTSKLSSKQLNSSIYILWVYDKKNNDTLLALNNKLEPFAKWQVVRLKNIEPIERVFKTLEIPAYKFKLQIYLDSIVNMNAYLFLYDDISQKSFNNRLSAYSNSYFSGKLFINKKPVEVYIGNKYFDHFFTKSAVQIKLKVVGEVEAKFDNQFFSLGDTIHVNGYDIKFLNVSANGQKLEWINLGKNNKNTYGFNTGYKFLPFDFYDLRTGNKINTDSILKKKKFLLIDFWGTWCKPCIASIPHTRELYAKYQKDIEIISVASERQLDTANVSDAIKKYQMFWLNTIVNNMDSEKHGSMLHNYRINAYPSFLLIDDSGKIVIRKIGYTNMETIDNFLKKRLGY